ncbi:hypothetical protein ANCDUO_05840 [Ancylostoma duodenale]|uniref:Fungal lipase-type domain-containing protein n=1 Tax=Ancylostoma duodenale TaxID=51022 RepID=A0A0C2GRD9_9BILA|nr:hypothetical protein ANCDUO_05840 [Ancylostoma duodenale]
MTRARYDVSGYRKGDQIMIYTFGEPRVGDETFATNFDALIPNSLADPRKVPQYGKTGCDVTLPEGKPGVFEQVVNKINVLTRTIGLE